MFVVTAAIRRARDVALGLRRLLVRALGGQISESAEGDGPPAHWVEYVRKRAPHLLEPGAMPSLTVGHTDRPGSPPNEPGWGTAAPQRLDAHSETRHVGGGPRATRGASYDGGALATRPAEGATFPGSQAARSVSPTASSPNAKARRRRWPWRWPRRDDRPGPAWAPMYQPVSPPADVSPSAYAATPVRVAGPHGQAYAPPAVASPAPVRFDEWSSATVVAVETVPSWPVRFGGGESSAPVFDPPAQDRVAPSRDGGYAEAFDPWPALPEPAPEESGWRAARDASGDERRLRREQRRL